MAGWSFAKQASCWGCVFTRVHAWLFPRLSKTIFLVNVIWRSQCSLFFENTNELRPCDSTAQILRD